MNLSTVLMYSVQSLNILLRYSMYESINNIFKNVNVEF